MNLLREEKGKRFKCGSRKLLAILLCLLMVLSIVPIISIASAEDVSAISTGVDLVGVSSGATPTFGKFVGSNSFFNENQATYEILGNIREYHPWVWTEWTAGDQADSIGDYSNTIKSMNPQATFMNTWGVFDNYYKTMYEKGIELTLCVTGGANDANARPSYQDPDGTRTEHPASYLGHAQSMFQLVARYGSNAEIDPALVRVAVGTEKRIGLGYIKYYENYNEPNLHGFTGGEFAAMLSADYDGHMGTLGPGVGVKAADPNAKLVMGGIAGIMYNATPHRNSDNYDPEFLQDMLEWFDKNRTLEQWKAAHGGSEEGYEKYPFDVLSTHSYCTTSTAAHGISPEADHMYEKVKGYVEYCNTNFPGKEVWLSEFGWDSAQGSPWSATVNSTVNTGLTGPEVQGRWLVREYLMLAAAGIDKARQFMIPDTSNDSNNPMWFATCGMVYGLQGSTNFKPSWYYVGTMSHVLKDASMDDIEIIADGGWTASGGGVSGVETNGPWALKFASTKSTDQIYALWLPTSLGDMGGANTLDYSVVVPAGYSHATLITMKDKTKWGERTDVSGLIEDGKISVPIGEKPVFLVLSEDEYYSPVYDYIHPHNFDTYTLTPNSGDPSFLFDENRANINSTPAPNMSNSWSPGGVHRYAVIDLSARYNLTNVFVWDRDGALAAGKVFAIHAYTGSGTPILPQDGMTSEQAFAMLQTAEWERVAWFDFATWDIWSEAIVDVETRYLVVGFEDGPSEFHANPWPVDWLPVPEMVLRGALAKGEIPPPPPPEPPIIPVVFDPKPDADEFRFLFDNDFDDGIIKAHTVGGAFTVIDGENADGTDGKILKVEGSVHNPGYMIPGSALSSMEHNRWYYIDYKFMLEDAASGPTMFLVADDSWMPVYTIGLGGGNTIKPIYSPDGDTVVVVPGQWHQIKAKVMIDSANNIGYEIFYDGRLIGSFKTPLPTKLPLDFLGIYMTAYPDTGRSTFYYDDVWVYTRNSSDTLLNATFDRLRDGMLKHGDDGLYMRDIYSRDAEIFQPKADDAFYLGDGDKLLKVTERTWMFDTTGTDTMQEIKVGEDYVFELSFFYEDANDGWTKTPTLLFVYNYWMLHAFANTDWTGGLWVLEQSWDGVEDFSAINIKPTPDEWHRYAVKYRFETVSKITYSFFYDDMVTPIVTVTLDAAVPGGMSYHTDNLISSMGFMVGSEGINMSEYPLYINDVLLYRGDIRPWPDKYGGIVPPVDCCDGTCVDCSCTDCDKTGPGECCEQKTFTVTFLDWDGAVLYSQSVAHGFGADIPADPVRTGYTFLGWYLGEAPYDFYTPVTNSITLVAHWQEIPIAIPITSLRIVTRAGAAITTQTIPRNSTMQFDYIVNTNALREGIVWSLSSTAFATVNTETGLVTTKSLSGTVVLTATDPPSGVSHSIVLRIT